MLHTLLIISCLFAGPVHANNKVLFVTPHGTSRQMTLVGASLVDNMVELQVGIWGAPPPGKMHSTWIATRLPVRISNEVLRASGLKAIDLYNLVSNKQSKTTVQCGVQSADQVVYSGTDCTTVTITAEFDAFPGEQ